MINKLDIFLPFVVKITSLEGGRANPIVDEGNAWVLVAAKVGPVGQ
jgi:hypothetical protein